MSRDDADGQTMGFRNSGEVRSFQDKALTNPSHTELAARTVQRWMTMIDYAYQCRDDIRSSSGATPRSMELRLLADEMRAALESPERVQGEARRFSSEPCKHGLHRRPCEFCGAEQAEALTKLVRISEDLRLYDEATKQPSELEPVGEDLNYYVAGPYLTGAHAGFHAVAELATGRIVHFFKPGQVAKDEWRSAYAKGFYAAIGWAKRPDLYADIGSPAYVKEMESFRATPPTAPAQSLEQALRDALEAMGSKKAQELSAGDLMAVVCEVDTPSNSTAHDAQAETVCYAAPEDLVRDGYSHSFYVHQTPPANRSDWVALCVNKQESQDADGGDADKPHTV